MTYSYSYNTLEEEIMAEIKNLTTFFPQDWQVGRDDAIMNRGADYLVIFKSSGVTTSTTWSSVDVLNNVSVPFELYARYYKNIDESKKRMSDVRDSISNLFMSYEFLRKSAGIMETGFTIGELQYVYLENAPAPVFLQHVVNLTIAQMVEREG